MKGPCKNDSDCAGSLICGSDNCPWAKGINCCKVKCQMEDNCCTANDPCRDDEGVCDSNEECLAGHSCIIGGRSGGDNTQACCKNVSLATLDKNCAPENRCNETEGECSSDEDCVQGLGLFCTQSCNWYNNWDRASCCERKPGLTETHCFTV